MISLGWTILFWVIIISTCLLCLLCIISGSFYRKIFRSVKFIRGVRCGLVIYLYIVLRLFIMDVYVVKGYSMRPTLLPGDYLVVSKIAYGGRLPATLEEVPILNLLLYLNPFPPKEIKTYKQLYSNATVQLGDVIVLNTPMYGKSFCVKRCHGVSGDFIDLSTVDSTAIGGQIPFVGKEISTVGEDSLDLLTRQVIRFYYNEQIKPFKIDREFVYVLGDNYWGSTDSKNWGPVPADHVIGKVIRVFPKRNAKK